MPVPPYQLFVEPLLRVLAAHPEGLRAGAAHEAAASKLGLTEADRAELLPSGKQAVFQNRSGWAHDRLKRAGLSESSSYGVWRLTESGMAFVAAQPGPLPDDELARITDIAEDNQAVGWQDRLAAFRADTTWVAERNGIDLNRSQILPEIQAFIGTYLAGAITLEDFRSAFDRKTRTDWATFGARGMGGGMILNKLAKHSPDPGTASKQLRALIAKPADEAAAADTIRTFDVYLQSARKDGPSGSKLPRSGRLPFFASLFWHLQDPEAWPVAYPSARDALAADGLYAPTGIGPAEDYLAFRVAFMKLQRVLGVSSWGLESLLRWTQRDEEVAVSPSQEEEDAEESTGNRVWLIALGRGAEHWDACYRDGIIAIGWNDLGDLRQYPSVAAIREKLREGRGAGEDPMNDGLACWQFASQMREGDTVYVKRGRHLVIGHGTVTSDYRHEPGRPMAHVRDVKWLGRGEWRPREKPLVTKTLTEISGYPGLVRDIRLALGLDDDGSEEEAAKQPAAPPYTLDDAEKDLFIDRADLREILELCRYKKNLILQGPPGVGKTFAAARLAYLLIGSASEDQIQRVQFHPSYSYEDFVQGLRPAEGGGFVRKDGPLLSFCKDALEDQASEYVLIIDEINRGNVSKILGELLSLLEADKRDPRYGVTLAYARDDEARFHVPPNLYVIGMMNTADRSLAFVDYALRRRFVFVDMEPAFKMDRFDADMTRRGVEASLRQTIRERLLALNERIAGDPTLGLGFRVGHSYFCQRSDAYDEAWFRRIVEYEIAPLLREYWFDSPTKLTEALAELRGE